MTTLALTTQAAPSCILPPTITEEVNGKLAQIEAKLKSLPASESKEKIDFLISKIGEIRNSGRFTDATSLCLIDTVKYRFQALALEIIDPTKNDRIENEKDPGAGLWIPKGTKNLYVADPESTQLSKYLPGCVNFSIPESDPSYYYRAKKCAESFSYLDVSGKGFDFSATGTVLSQRVTSISNIESDKKDIAFAITGYDGGGVGGAGISASLSQIPGDFSDPRCTYSSMQTLSILIGKRLVNGINQACEIKPNTPYYINLRINGSYAHGRFRMIIGQQLRTGFSLSNDISK